MPNWSDLLNEFRKLPNDDEKSTWLSNRLDQQLAEIGDRRDQNVIVYASGFLQKPSVPSFATSISREDINGLMCGLPRRSGGCTSGGSSVCSWRNTPKAIRSA